MSVVLFDLLGVLCVGGQALEPIVRRVPPPQLPQVLHALAGVSADNAGQVAQLVSQHSGVELAQVQQALADGPRLDEQLLGYIRHELAPQHRVGLLTNADRPMVQGIMGEHLELFDPVLISAELGMNKPDRRIYEHAIAVAGCPAEQVVFIDDSPENVEGASACGITALVYPGVDALRETLRSRQREQNAGHTPARRTPQPPSGSQQQGVSKPQRQ